MSDNQLSDEQMESLTIKAKGMAALVIARLIGTGAIIPNEIRSKKRFSELISKLGRNSDYAFEIHIDHTEERIKSIQLCLENVDPQSAILLLHTLIEGEINTAVRVLLRIRGYTNQKITETIQGVDLKSKLEVLLPLLGVQPSPLVCQIRSETQNIRNRIVHFKAIPTIATDDGENNGDHDVTLEKAKNFFRSHSIESIKKDLTKFVDVCVSQAPEIQAAYALLQRFSA